MTADRKDDMTGSAVALLESASGAHPWRVAERLPADVLRSGGDDLTPLQIQLLHNRGITGVATMRAFLGGDWRAHEPRLPGTDAAVARVMRAIRLGERITVFGDYDADGMTSCALMHTCLRALGATVDYHMPRRDDDGRGPNPAALGVIARRGTRLLVTTDCGISSCDELSPGQRHGMDVIITDHHQPRADGVLPADCVIVHPLLDPECGDAADLAGVGVAFWLAVALLRAGSGDASRAERRVESLLDLVAIGTVGDVVPLSPLNWTLVRAGLRRIQQCGACVGTGALLAVAGVAPEEMTEGDIGYRLAPRLNSASRLGEPETALQLLLAADEAEAARLAQRMDELNRIRQRELEQLVADARMQLPDRDATAGSSLPLIVRGEGWPVGYLGLVAGRLAEEHGVPAYVLSLQGSGVYRASARAPEGADLMAVLSACDDLFDYYGGHSGAAGFTIAADRLDALIAHLRADIPAAASHDLLSATAGRRIPRELVVDGELDLARIDLERWRQVRALAPFGAGFAEPLFVARDVRLSSCWQAGPGGRALRLALRQRGAEARMLWPRAGHLYSEIRAELRTLPPLDVLFELDAYRSRNDGELVVSARVRALAPSQR